MLGVTLNTFMSRCTFKVLYFKLWHWDVHPVADSLAACRPMSSSSYTELWVTAVDVHSWAWRWFIYIAPSHACTTPTLCCTSTISWGGLMELSPTLQWTVWIFLHFTHNRHHRLRKLAFPHCFCQQTSSVKGWTLQFKTLLSVYSLHVNIQAIWPNTAITKSHLLVVA